MHGSVTQTTTPLLALANRHFRAAAGGPSEAAVKNNDTAFKCLAGWFACSLACLLEQSHVAPGGSKVLCYTARRTAPVSADWTSG